MLKRVTAIASAALILGLAAGAFAGSTSYFDTIHAKNLYANMAATNGLINVTAYGAKCDGVTDDSAAFTMAINAAEGTGKTVFIPPSQHGCLVSSLSPINIGDFTIAGSGCGYDNTGTVPNGSMVITPSGFSGTVFAIADGSSGAVYNLTIEGLCIHNLSASQSGYAIYTDANAGQTTAHLRVSNVSIDNFATALGLISVVDSTFSNLDLRNDTTAVALGNATFGNTFYNLDINNPIDGIVDIATSYSNNFYGGTCEIDAAGAVQCVDIKQSYNTNFYGWDMETDTTHQPSNAVFAFSALTAGADKYDGLYSSTIADNASPVNVAAVYIENCQQCQVVGGAVTGGNVDIASGSTNTLVVNVYHNVAIANAGVNSEILDPSLSLLWPTQLSCSGTATLASGAASVTNSCLSASRPVFCTEQNSSAPSSIGCTISGTTLSIKSASSTDASSVSWFN